MMAKARILSGMRPTGKLHIGHLVGALDNWKVLQEDYDCFYMVADWHALMSEYEDASNLRAYGEEMVVDWIACGIDPERSTLFVQSEVKEHAELSIIFSNLISLARLERCPTYKEQLKEMTGRDLATFGFLGYPVLQAADILLYKGNLVPVGNDQLPHIEITREIARKFNSLYGEVFPEPEGKLTETARLLGTDGRKMSKSYDNTVNLSDDPETIKKRIMSAFTDPQRKRRDDPGRPEICNLHAYYQSFAPDRAETVAEECRTAARGCTDCKAELAECLAELLAPIREKREEILASGGVKDVLEAGREKAASVAGATLAEAMKAVGLR
jgi:tryptophanyl-tRNA synthetase